MSAKRISKPIALVSEIAFNITEGYVLGESGEYKPFTANPGELFRAFRTEYGRCISRVYVDDPSGKGGTRAVGWVFRKRMKYEDARDNSPKSWYLRDVWVTLHSAPTTTTKTPHYAEVS